MLYYLVLLRHMCSPSNSTTHTQIGYSTIVLAVTCPETRQKMFTEFIEDMFVAKLPRSGHEFDLSLFITSWPSLQTPKRAHRGPQYTTRPLKVAWAQEISSIVVA